MALDTGPLFELLSLTNTGGYTSRATRALATAVSRCESFTRRTIEPDEGDPVKTVTTRATAMLHRVPDLRQLVSCRVLSGTQATTIDPAAVEMVTWGHAQTAAWLRLPFDPVGRPLIEVTGRFGMSPIRPDLEDSLYTYAAARWNESKANLSGTAMLDDGSVLSYDKQLPTSVRGVWNEYRIPDAPFATIPIGL